MTPSDQQARTAAIHERSRNVVIDAGAGTGKTSTLVDRVLALVAPREDRAAPMRLDRIAAVTFTRRAAGELRLRLRERLLAEVAREGLSAKRLQRLRSALGQLDGAHIGTIHSFADRLLRLHPVEARLSPAYTIAEDDEALVAATFARLLHGAEADSLAAELGGSAAAERASEVAMTVRDALRAGIRASSQEGPFVTRTGLDAMVEGFVRQRDVPPDDPPLPSFDRGPFDQACHELRALVAGLQGSSAGARWLRDLAETLERLATELDPIALRAILHPALHALKSPTLKDVFEDDKQAWHVWKLFDTGKSQKVVREAPLRDDLLVPFQRWFANRLVRSFPVVVALYEQVKAEHQAVDTVDLLLKLRDLLATNKPVRAHYQSLFDHLFVDEFQDTDPLQAEVILFLCEKESVADHARDIVLADGKLTLVGDPKQSIYRFRRADIAMYESVRAKVASGPHKAIRLTANFRSTPPLIEWFNDRFEALLGAPPAQGQPVFNAETGEVAYQPLSRGRTDGTTTSIHVVPFEPDADKPSAEAYRTLEATVLARYLRWLVEHSDVEVLDLTTRKRRRVGYADIAVLAFETTNLPLLFPELDAVGVPHAARGGTLFLQDPLHKQFLLGLRAIADREDGVAQAAFYRPPFFSIDVDDLVANTPAADAARAIMAGLRAARFTRSPGVTARDLLEHTAFGRTIALGPNGAQRLDRLRELCLVVETTAARDGLDFDGVTARLRDWAVSPIQLDAPHPVGSEAVQILTVHQAKGLEFPVVVLWDGRAGMGARAEHGPWHVQRDGRAWQLSLDGLSWEEPPGAALKETEKRYCDAERKRLIYVAATRARDLVVVPKAGTPDQKHVAGMLLAGGHGPLSLQLQTYRPAAPPVWARAIDLPLPRSLEPADDAEAARSFAAQWVEHLTACSQPRFTPMAVTVATHGEIPPDAPLALRRPSRFGPVFGDTVHRAIGAVLQSRSLSPTAAVARARRVTGLRDHLDEAVADVARAVTTLADLTQSGATMRLEYPVVGQSGDNMLVGYIDLLIASATELIVIDFKTDLSDTSEAPLAQVFPGYVEQLRSYVSMLRGAGLVEGRTARAALLFTDLGALRWIGF